MAEETTENKENQSTQEDNSIDGLEEIKEEELPQADALEEVKGSENDDEQQILEEGTSNVDSQDEAQEDLQEYGVQKKLGKLQKILIGVVGSLLLIIIIGLILFLTGFFDSEEVEQTPTQVVQTQVEPVVEEKPKYIFKSEDIDENRLNKKLALLTKYELVEDPEIEKQKTLEQQNILNSINSQSNSKLDETKQENVEEKQPQTNNTIQEEETAPTTETNEENSSVVDEQAKAKDESEMKEEDLTEKPDLILEVKEEDVIGTNDAQDLIPDIYEGEKFLKFIQVATLKYKLYNTFLSQIKDIDARISICKYKENQTQIFIGPFENEVNRDILIKKINESVVNDAFKIEFTQEEFDKRCNF